MHREDQRILPALVQDERYPHAFSFPSPPWHPHRGGCGGGHASTPVAPVTALGMLPHQTGAVSGTPRCPAAPGVEERPSTAPAPVQRGVGMVLRGAVAGDGGSISLVEKKWECFCPFCCPPCCRLVPKASPYGCGLMEQGGTPGLPPERAGCSKRETSKQKNRFITRTLISNCTVFPNKENREINGEL